MPPHAHIRHLRASQYYVNNVDRAGRTFAVRFRSANYVTHVRARVAHVRDRVHMLVCFMCGPGTHKYARTCGPRKE